MVKPRMNRGRTEYRGVRPKEKPERVWESAVEREREEHYLARLCLTHHVDVPCGVTIS